MHPGFVPKPGKIVASEHWCSSGFANTDLDMKIRRQGIEQLIAIGPIAHTYVESTVRFGAELGYGVTLVRDATAYYSEMHAALDVDIPRYATAIVTANEVVDLMSCGRSLELVTR
jgi:ureidoacrylate peracid hydrolase